VMVFMPAYYLFCGWIANLGLIVYMIVVIGGMAAFGSTLTLPGIAGFILSVGMAVDTNILKRVKDKMSIRKTFSRHPVMVDHDHIHAVRTRDLDLFFGRNTAVHGHDEPHPVFPGFMDRGFAYTVAVALTFRKKSRVFAAEFVKGPSQNRDACDPVHIIVPVDQYFFFVVDSFFEARFYLSHALHQERIVKLGETGKKKGLDLGRNRKPAFSEKFEKDG